MSMEKLPSKPSKEEAQRLMALLNSLSLFSRKTLVAWLPELVSETGITEERFMVLFELSMQPSVSLKYLAQSLMVSPSSLSVMINSMVEQGLVSRLPDPEDRRRVLLRLDSQGEYQLQKAEEHLVGQFQQYLNQLPEKDRKELNSATGTLLKVIERILQRPHK